MATAIDVSQAQQESSLTPQLGNAPQLCEGAVEGSAGSDEDDLRSDGGADGNQPKSQSPISYAISATSVYSIFQQGPGISVGSASHPNGCEPCVYYCFSKRGCNKGEACTQCHAFHESKLRKKRAQWKKEVRSSYRARVAKKLADDITPQVEAAPNAAAMQTPQPASDAMLLPTHGDMAYYNSAGAAPNRVSAKSWPSLTEALGFEDDIICSASKLDAGMMGAPLISNSTETMKADSAVDIFSYSQSNVIVTVGQKIEIWPLLTERLIFAVAPDLPKGFTMDIYSGLIHGSAQEVTGAATYFVTACEPGALTGKIKIAVVEISIVNPLPLPTHNWMPNTVSYGAPVVPVVPAPGAKDVVNVERVIANHLQEQLWQTVVALRHAEQLPHILGLTPQ